MKAKSEQKIKWALYYWIGAIFQISLMSLVIAILKMNKIEYGNVVNLVVLLFGGTSSAIWGIIISIKSKRVDTYKKIVVDFFCFKQPIKNYFICIIFLIINFGISLFSGQITDGVKWYSFITFFLVAIVFGGIEEIGWRYTFQPIIEKKLPYEIASLITFISWGIWHYLYFYITGTLQNINHATFLVGLLGSCFILGAIYKVSNSLWLCVMYHALLNMFSQTLVVASLITTIVTNSIAILLSIWLIRGKKKNS